MITPRFGRRLTVPVLVALSMLAPLVTTQATAAAAVPTRAAASSAVRRDLPEPPPTDIARAELDELTVAAPHPMTGYSRSKFPHWITQHGTCDTRETVLVRDGQDVLQDDQCRAVTGTWTSAYDGKVSSKPSTEVDIDHMVPLANGWRSGADEWTTVKRRQFANDLETPNSSPFRRHRTGRRATSPPTSGHHPCAPIGAPTAAPGPT